MLAAAALRLWELPCDGSVAHPAVNLYCKAAKATAAAWTASFEADAAHRLDPNTPTTFNHPTLPDVSLQPLRAGVCIVAPGLYNNPRSRTDFPFIGHDTSMVAITSAAEGFDFCCYSTTLRRAERTIQVEPMLR